MLLAASCFGIIKCNMCERDSITMHDYQRCYMLSGMLKSKARSDTLTHIYVCIYIYTILSLLVLNLILVGAPRWCFCCSFYIFSTDLCKFSVCITYTHAYAEACVRVCMCKCVCLVVEALSNSERKYKL